MIYLDNNATTPCDPRVVEAMLPYFYELPGNAASRNHVPGWIAADAVQVAREQLAQLIGADARELVFTSGATEACHLAIKGVFEQYRRKGSHLVTLKTEHKAVLEACAQLERSGASVTYLDVDEEGLIDLGALEGAIRPDTLLVAIMWGNNETGVLQPMAEIGAICERKGTLLMSDATQVAGKMPVSPRETGVHLMAFSAHKMYGPKGMGALYFSRRQPKVSLAAQLAGGGQEQGLRAGTLNVPGIVGFGKAAELAAEEMPAEAERLRQWRDRIEAELLTQFPGAYRNGHPLQRLGHVANLAFPGLDAEQLMMSFNQELALSSGAACTSAAIQPSHVLTAMGRSEEEAFSALRFSLGRFNTLPEIARAIALVRDSAARD